MMKEIEELKKHKKTICYCLKARKIDLDNSSGLYVEQEIEEIKKAEEFLEGI